MIILASIRLALRALRRNLLRTLLTMLGIIIGVAAVISVVSIGNGAKKQVEAQIATLGQNVILVLSGNVSRGGFSMGFGTAGTLTQPDLEAIRKEVEGVEGASPEVRVFSQLAYGNQNANVQVSGVSADYLSIRAWPLKSGENFTEQDVRGATKVAIIGQTTKKTLFGDQDAVGQSIRIKNAPFTIVGELAPKGMNMMGSDQDDIVLVPFSSALKRLAGGTSFRSISVQASDAKLVPGVQHDLDDLLRQRHKIQDGRDPDFLIRTQQEISNVATSTSRVLTVLLGSVAGVSLVVGGIGIMNIMLVSVTERTREIGVRLAIGARTRDIMMQFLFEAIALSVIGGIIGIGLGAWISGRLSGVMGSPTVVAANSILIAFGSSALIGIVFGYFPALKAARLDPIEALRFE